MLVLSGSPAARTGKSGSAWQTAACQDFICMFYLLANMKTHRLHPPLDGHQVRHPLSEPVSKVVRVDGHKTLTLKAQTSRWRCKWPSKETWHSQECWHALIVLIFKIRKVRVYFNMQKLCLGSFYRPYYWSTKPNTSTVFFLKPLG